MSDVFEGPGWWMASNGKWYAPEHHPDERYRSRYNAPDPVPSEPVVAPEPTSAEPPQPEQAAEVVQAAEPPATATYDIPESPEIPEVSQIAVVDVPTFDTPGSANTETTNIANVQAAVADRIAADSASADFPSVELQPESEDSSPATPLTELARSETESVTESAMTETAELSGIDLANEMARVASQREQEATLAEKQERAKADVFRTLHATPDSPVDDVQPVPGEPIPTDTRAEFSIASTDIAKNPDPRPVFEDVRPPSVAEPAPRTSIGFTKVELDQPSTTPTNTVSRPTVKPKPAASRSSSTELVHVPELSPRVSIATARDRVVAVGMFLGGVAMIVGSFLAWTEGEGTETGWERGEGIVTVIAGILGASMAGPIFVGFRHAIPKTIAITAGVIASIALGLLAVNSVLNDPEVTFGLGFIVTGIATAVMLISAIGDEGEFLDN